ncbi:AraC family transcriptional regulator [Paenibacillus pinihumi]|uniref:AraC family transcriptional regulator n=1 Tax=Paenibacillus pinihumi TaxID=669462 RepID=UPI0003FE6E1F|nr:AraC family transcriptional regulator [Paenibacillus pinihumi]
MNTYSVSVSLFYSVLKALALKGCDQEEFFRFAGVDRTLLQDAEGRIPEEEFERIVEAAAEFTGDDAFGLLQGQAADLSDLGILGYVLLHSSTIGEALRAFQKYNTVTCSGYNISWETEGELTGISFLHQNPLKTPSRLCIEDMASSLYHLMLKLGCRPIRIHGIYFRHAPSGGPEIYNDVFCVQPQFHGDENKMVISREALDYPVVLADQRLLGMFEQLAQEAMDRLKEGRPFSDELYSWILKKMPERLPLLTDCSRAFRVSKRTLQARLKEENTTFNEMLARARKELATAYLAKPEYQIGEIAYLLHYSEPSAFQNAFKTWTGTTPGKYRTQRQAEMN